MLSTQSVQPQEISIVCHHHSGLAPGIPVNRKVIAHFAWTRTDRERSDQLLALYAFSSPSRQLSGSAEQMALRVALMVASFARWARRGRLAAQESRLTQKLTTPVCLT
jgi:hypothetical protein